MTGKRGAMPQETMIVALSAIGPVIGSGIGVFKRPTTAYIRNLLYFAAGIMLAISFLDLIPESIHLGGRLTCVTGLSLGAATMALLDRQFPHVHDCAACGEEACQLGHAANFLILAIFLHNFPEGMAIAVGAATDVGDSLVIAMAIAIHNIPEGICTSAPHYFTYGTEPVMEPYLSPDITVKELLDHYPQLMQLFMDLGLLCIGCPAEAFHTLADVAREYHLDLDQLLQRIDIAIGSNRSSQELPDPTSGGSFSPK
jgi:ZIP family zinc transporter